ncbi:MAG: carbohydrate ABC transporter substrate-binding protein [Ruminococcus sp.]|nr:carbohydrate ABC transporter substrate-binding protein [Ruminococcus sp.]
MKRMIAFMTAGAMALLCSCGEDKSVVLEQTQQTEITLSWWGNDVRTEYTLEAVELFEEKYPYIKVKCSYSEWSGYEARSQVQMISGTEADVMQINLGWLSQYSEDGSGYYDIEALGDTVDLSCFSPEVLEYGRRNGVLNAVPIAMNAETVYINKTVYDSYGLAVPAAWEDFFEAAKVMKKDGVYPMSGASKSMWLFCVAYAEQMTGKHFFNENSEMTFNKDDLKLMIDFYCRMVNEDVIPKVEDYQRLELEDGSYAGTVAWVSDAVNYMGTAMDNGYEIVAAPYPAAEGCESGDGWYAKPATLYAVSCNTEHPKEAALLLDFMLNSPQWAELQGIEKGIPISSAARDHLDETGMLEGLQYDASLVMETNTRLGQMNSLIESGDLFDRFIDSCDLVIFDKESSEQAAEELYELYRESYAMAE